MTEAEPKPRKPRAARKKPAAGDQDIAALKARIVEAALVAVPFDGFTDKALAHAAAEAGVEPSVLAQLFPNGALSLVEAFSEQADAEMTKRLSKTKLSSLRVRERIALAVRTRIAVLKPNKEAARRAAAFLTLPPHAALGLKLVYRTVDSIWRAIGDTSTDFNFYTKRAILAGVYSTTLMRWFTDESEGEADTETFLAARIEDVMRFEKLKAQIRERAKNLPSLSDILNPSSRSGSRRRS
jgi:ubiquinone biosynthesis protein COQ9